MTERIAPALYPEKDLVLEVMFTLQEKPSKPNDLADKMWDEWRSPLTTLPAIQEALSFLERKELVKKSKRNIFRLTDEGKRALTLHPNYLESTRNSN